MKLKRYLEACVKQAKASDCMKVPGYLRIVKAGTRTQYYQMKSGSRSHGRYIRKEEEAKAAALAQKSYNITFCREAEKIIRAIEDFESSIRPVRAVCESRPGAFPGSGPGILPESRPGAFPGSGPGILPESRPGAFPGSGPGIPPENMSGAFPESGLGQLFEKLPAERKKLVNPIILPDDLYAERWQAQEYEGKDFSDGDPEILTEKGERVRSKSEKIIADKLALLGIPYHYEYPFLLGAQTIYPDFTVLNRRSRQVYIWEHLGMMDDQKYAAAAVRRIDQYIRTGIFPGKQLILTAEVSARPLDIRAVERMAEEFLM